MTTGLDPEGVAVKYYAYQDQVKGWRIGYGRKGGAWTEIRQSSTVASDETEITCEFRRMKATERYNFGHPCIDDSRWWRLLSFSRAP